MTEYRHWRLEQDDDGILWLTLDRADSKVNALSRAVLEELEDLLHSRIPTEARGLVLRSGKTSGFVFGADVQEFTTLKNSDQALALIQRAQATFQRLEDLPFPTLALIHGFCLGGGLELALACRYRIASEDAKLGLPEVKLGIHPGFGGTVRITQKLGAPAAMDLMLTGRTVSAKSARRLGLVDKVVPERHLLNAARMNLLKPPKVKLPPLWARLASVMPLRPLMANILRSQASRHARPEHYPAPFALIDVWKRAGGSMERQYREEARSAAELITGRTARNLIRIFLLQERLKGLAKQTRFQPRFVHVVGGGAMGGDIAAWCALQGLLVTVQDVDHGRLAKVLQRARELFRKVLKEPRLVQAALDRLVPDMSGDGAARADVIIEAIFENLEAKQELFRAMEPRMKPGALLATNTSSIPLEELAGVLAKPERLVGLHFFNPVSKMQLVEVVRGQHTEQTAVDQALAFVGAIRRLPLPVKSSPGFLVNRILMPYLLEAFLMEAEGMAPELIDRAALDFGMPMGPILLADTVGLDVCLSVAKIFCAHLGGEVPKRLEELVTQGHFGKKSGQGFYDHRSGASHHPPPAGATERLGERLVLPLLNASVACLREKVVEDADLLDAGVVFGTGFAPFRGGPMRHAAEQGAEKLLQELHDFEGTLGTRFAPDPGWSEIAAVNP
jgi:3-hydroxyacyl-CoA dehydrogenase / enoyl-CoA hydratase / 3-hydroxybutyryl-CoA epimerase